MSSKTPAARTFTRRNRSRIAGAIAGVAALLFLAAFFTMELASLGEFAAVAGTALSFAAVPMVTVPKLPLRTRVEGLTYQTDSTTTVKLPKGLLLDRLVISGSYQVVVTGTATSVRATGVPIKRIAIVADNGTTIKSIKPRDAIARAQYFAKQPLASVVSPPSATSGTVTGQFDIPIFFGEPHSTDWLRFKTGLPTWLYNELYLQIDWGGHNEIFVPAASTGVVTLVAGGGGTGLSVQAYQWEGYDMGPGGALAFAASQGVGYESYSEHANSAANTDLLVDLPRTEDIRTILITTEDSNSEPVNTVLNAVSVEENNITGRVNRIDARAVRMGNASDYGLPGTPNTGVYAIEFAEDRDIENILQATGMSALRLRLNVNAVTTTIRVHTVRFGASRVG